RTRDNRAYLPGHQLPSNVTVTSELARAVGGARLVLGVTPSHAIRDVLGRAVKDLDDGAVVINASKGLVEGTLKRIDEIYADVLPPAHAARAVFLSGPTFAREVAAGLPSAIVVAGRDAKAVELVQAELASERFRVYSSDDVV